MGWMCRRGGRLVVTGFLCGRGPLNYLSMRASKLHLHITLPILNCRRGPALCQFFLPEDRSGPLKTKSVERSPWSAPP